VNRTLRLSDVARAAGVSQGTVSNVFNHPEIVRPELRERVHEAARRIGYRGPDPKGRLLRAGKVNAIGVATDEPLSYFFADPFSRALMTGITEVCDENRAGISLVSTASQTVLSWNIGSALVDGFILFCMRGAEQLVVRSRERQLPFVALSTSGGEADVPSIGVDNVDGGRQAAAHLLALGHARFAVLTLQVDASGTGAVTREAMEDSVQIEGRDRLRGNFEVLAASGIDVSKIPVFQTREDRRTVLYALETLFAAPEPPTALLAHSDSIAMIVLDWLKEKGRNVPKDVSIVSFDGVPESALTYPPLTTVAQPIRRIGRRAAEIILDPGDAQVHETFEVELIVRGSTAPPRR